MKKFLPIALCAVLCACGGTRVVNLDDERDVQTMQDVMELEYRDWTNTAEKMTKSMLESGAFEKVKDPVIAIGDIENETMQRFDTDILIKKIRTTLVNSGAAKVTTAFQNKKTADIGYVPVNAELSAASVNPFGAAAVNAKSNGYAAVVYERDVAEDETTHQVRENRGNPEYDQSTVVQSGTLVSPNLSLTGKMIQRNLKLQSGLFSSVDTRVEYYLQLTLTDIKTGLSVWEDEQPIIKEGDHAPTW